LGALFLVGAALVPVACVGSLSSGDTLTSSVAMDTGAVVSAAGSEDLLVFVMV
jgi:hypothetical protein